MHLQNDVVSCKVVHESRTIKAHNPSNNKNFVL